MRISFDLDEVLFVDPKRYEIEKPPRGLAARLYSERLRKGTPELIHELQKRGFEVWVYTSSYRTENYIKRLFRLYGVTFDEPIMVAKMKEGDYKIINGHHRWAAAIKTELKQVRVVVTNPGTENLVGLL